MHHYKKHIGDFDRKTKHLTRIERSVYQDMIELYYDEETQLPLDFKKLCRKVRAITEEEVTAVQQVLNEFFVKTPNGWWQARCEEVIEEYRNSTTQKSEAGKASAAKKALKRELALKGISTNVEQALNGESTANQLTSNHKPLTINHKPRTKEKNTPASAVVRPDSVPEDVWNDFLQVRKLKKMHLSITAWDQMRREIERAGLTHEQALRECCARGWGSFKAAWIERDQPKGGKGKTDGNDGKKPDKFADLYE